MWLVFFFRVGVIVGMSITILFLVPSRSDSRSSSHSARCCRGRGVLVLIWIWMLVLVVVIGRNSRIIMWFREAAVLLPRVDSGICYHHRPTVRAPGLAAGS